MFNNPIKLNPFCYSQATKSSLSENEKREKRAMERKISEMEEELKVNFFKTFIH